MYVVIAGGGKVGRSIAVDLLREHHDVAIIELVEDRCEELLRDHDLLVIHGDACEVRYLEQARVERADVFVATTHDDDDNFVACQLALATFDVPRAIARVNAPHNEEIFDRMNIEAVSTTTLITANDASASWHATKLSSSSWVVATNTSARSTRACSR